MKKLSRRRAIKLSGFTLISSLSAGNLDTTQPSNTFTIETFEGGPLVEYEFTVDGAVTKGPEADDNDSITETNGTTEVTGAVGDGFPDNFRVAEKPTSFSANVDSSNYRLLYNGSEVSIPDSGGGGNQPSNTFTIETFEGGPLVEYEFTVDGAVTKGPEADDNDSITETNGTTEVTGAVGDGFPDNFNVAERPTDFSANVDSSNYRLLYNGSEISDGPPRDELDITLSQIDADDFPEIDTFASVRDDDGDPITGLDSGDFELDEDGTDQTITSLDTVGQSSSNLNVALVIDTSGSMNTNNRISDARDGAQLFVDTLQSNDQAAVLEFNDTVSTVQPFTADKSDLEDAIGGLSANGNTALFDGVESAINLTAGTSGRQAIIVLADGENNRDVDNDNSTVQDVIDFANRNNIPIYAIGLETNSFNPQNLQGMANETGGLYFDAADSSNLTEIYDDISTTISAEYRLQYTTTNSSRDGTERTVEVAASSGGQEGTDTGTYVAPSDQTGTICPETVDIPSGGTGEMPVVLGGIENGFAGAEFLFTFPEIVTPTSVSVNSDFDPIETNVTDQTVRVIVSDINDNFQSQRAQDGFELCRIQLQAEDDGAGSVAVDPIQVDDDTGAEVSVRVGQGCGEITVEAVDECPTVDGTRTTDPDGDGICEDFNGNGRKDFDDVNTFFDELNNPSVENNVDAFDFNQNGRIDFADLIELFEEIQQ